MVAVRDGAAEVTEVRADHRLAFLFSYSFDFLIFSYFYFFFSLRVVSPSLRPVLHACVAFRCVAVDTWNAAMISL